MFAQCDIGVRGGLDHDAVVPLACTEPENPPSPPPQSIVMAFVMVRVPNSPGSRQSISPPAVVLAIAPAKVLQGVYGRRYWYRRRCRRPRSEIKSLESGCYPSELSTITSGAVPTGTA